MVETKEKYDKPQQQSIKEEDLLQAEQQQMPDAFTDEEDEDEIDLSDLIRQVWARRRIVMFTTLITFLFGIAIAMLSSEEYEASIVLMPQSSSSGNNIASGLLRQFGGLAGLGGDGGGSGTLSPSLYPEITQSTPFFLHMIQEEMYYSTLDTTVNFVEYFGSIQQPGVLDYVKAYTIGLPRLILKVPGNIAKSVNKEEHPSPAAAKPQADTLQTAAADTAIRQMLPHEPIGLTRKQLGVINKLKGRIKTTIESNGTVKLATEMPDPHVAARTTAMAVSYLTNYIQEYRTEKAAQDLAFIEKQYREKKEKYDQAQQRLARFRDRNTNIFTESARVELERLQTENNLAFSLYQGLAQQLEQAKIKVQEETPVFKVLEPIQVPLSISKPKRELIITASLFAGIFLGFGLIFLQIMYLHLKHKIS